LEGNWRIEKQVERKLGIEREREREMILREVKGCEYGLGLFIEYHSLHCYFGLTNQIREQLLCFAAQPLEYGWLITRLGFKLNALLGFFLTRKQGLPF